MASLMSYSILENGARDGGVRPYPLLRRHDYAQRQLRATLVITVSLTITLSMLIGVLMFTGFDEDATTMLSKYGPQKCPLGINMLEQPINNFSPCCTHYAATCCNLYGEKCKEAFDFAAPQFPRPELCDDLLELLSCARCSAYAGYYDDSSAQLPFSAKPNITLCESFCDELWNACGLAYTSRTHGAGDELQRFSARHFCEDRLGLRVADSTEGVPCFSGATLGSKTTVWLSLIAPALLTIFQAWHSPR